MVQGIENLGVDVKKNRVNEVVLAGIQGSILTGTVVFVRDNRGSVLTENVLMRVYCIFINAERCTWLSTQRGPLLIASSLFSIFHKVFSMRKPNDNDEEEMGERSLHAFFFRTGFFHKRKKKSNGFWKINKFIWNFKKSFTCLFIAK